MESNSYSTCHNIGAGERTTNEQQTLPVSMRLALAVSTGKAPRLAMLLADVVNITLPGTFRSFHDLDGMCTSHHAARVEHQDGSDAEVEVRESVHRILLFYSQRAHAIGLDLVWTIHFAYQISTSPQSVHIQRRQL